MKRLSVRNSHPYEATGHGHDKAVVVTKVVFIAAPAKVCFGTIAKQLEQPAGWDRLIRHVWPLSEARGRVGAMSRVLVNLGNTAFHSTAVVSQYRPSRILSWGTVGYPGICVRWVLEPEQNGTVVGLTLFWEASENVLNRLVYKITTGRQVASDLKKTLAQLKSVVEDSVSLTKSRQIIS